MTDFNNNGEVLGEEELAVSVHVQQMASLYGIASTLVGTGMAPNKKAMKKVIKKLSKEIKNQIGPDGAKDIMSQNAEVCENILMGIRKDPQHAKPVRKKLLRTVVDTWYVSYQKGLNNLQWQTN